MSQACGFRFLGGKELIAAFKRHFTRVIFHRVLEVYCVVAFLVGVFMG